MSDASHSRAWSTPWSCRLREKEVVNLQTLLWLRGTGARGAFIPPLANHHGLDEPFEHNKGEAANVEDSMDLHLITMASGDSHIFYRAMGGHHVRRGQQFEMLPSCLPTWWFMA